MEINKELYDKQATEISLYKYFGQVFDYEGDELSSTYHEFFVFAQKNLKEDLSKFGINDTFFLYHNSQSCNARAIKDGKYRIIFFYKGMFETLYTRLIKQPVFTIDPNLRHELNSILPVPFEKFIFNLLLLFVYYHELTHIAQQKKILSETLDENVSGSGNTFSIVSHIREFDADNYSCHFIALHIIKYFQKYVLQKGYQIMTRFIEISLSAIYFYFSEITSEINSYYLRDHAHPHPFLRLVRISESIIENLKLNGLNNVNKKEILKNALNLYYDLFSSDGLPLQQRAVAKEFFVRASDVANYFHEIEQEQKKLNYLITFRSKKLKSIATRSTYYYNPKKIKRKKLAILKRRIPNTSAFNSPKRRH